MSENAGTKLSPLLPIEFCTIDRAARLLGCELEDIIHWVQISAIKLCVQVKNANVSTFVSDFDLSKCEEVDSWHRAILSNWASVVARFEPNEHDSDHYGVETKISGFWTVQPWDVQIDGQGKWIQPEKFAYVVPYVDNSALTDCRSNFFVDLNTIDNIDLNEAELLIMRPDLVRLHKAITTGEPLPNRFNDQSIKEEIEIRQRRLLHNPRISNESKREAIALMAWLLASKSAVFKHGERPNSKTITKGIEEMGKELLPDSAIDFSLSNFTREISMAVKFLDESYPELKQHLRDYHSRH